MKTRQMQILNNARLVLPNQVITGSLTMEAGKIAAIDQGRHPGACGQDCRGDLLLPGLIELHTDNLEKYIVPRPGIYWPSTAHAIIAHDNQIFNAGITTVLDAVALGFSDESEIRSKIMAASITAVKQAAEKRLLKADHFLHLRCELPSATVVDDFAANVDDPLLKLVSVMDHTPGQRQWRDLPKWRLYHRDKKWSDADAQAVIDRRRSLQETYAASNRSQIMSACRENRLPVASHDDTTFDHCQEAWQEGITISEFPTTLEAARAAKSLGMHTILGAPNMVRGQSHSGNISANDLADAALLDGFSSDYMPISLLHSAFVLHERVGVELPAAVATVTDNIAKMIRLEDRGALEVGKKADLIRVQMVDGLPLVKSIWKNGCLISNLIHD
jgi:alpha-D-ribose 1-methylphosphonate 5-triphosphate diphosphatase